MNGNRIHKLLEKASGFLEVGDFTNAELNYREVLSLAQNHSVALNNLGVIAFRTQRYALAMQYFEAVLQIEPDNSAFVLNLANTLHTLGYWEMLHHLLDTKDKVLGGAGVHLKNMVFGKKIGRKLFCVGFNKTGTTSLELALSSLGFHMGNQARGELLFRDWCNRKFERIIQLATTADAFQDIPFSLPYTFQVMDLSFPDAKFILTVRDDPEQWYQSISTFHAKIVNGGIHTPTLEELGNFQYRYKGYILDVLEGLFSSSIKGLYNKDYYMDCYKSHNDSVIDYFKYRADKLLVLNVSETDAMQKLCKFLSIEWSGQTMPHMNKT